MAFSLAQWPVIDRRFIQFGRERGGSTFFRPLIKGDKNKALPPCEIMGAAYPPPPPGYAATDLHVYPSFCMLDPNNLFSHFPNWTKMVAALHAFLWVVMSAVIIPFRVFDPPSLALHGTLLALPCLPGPPSYLGWSEIVSFQTRKGPTKIANRCFFPEKS